MATATIDFTGTDQMSVFVGASLLTEDTTAAIVEFSTSSTYTNGAFGLFSPTSNVVDGYNFQSRGTANSQNSLANSAERPETAVFSGLAGISNDRNVFRKNGAVLQSVTNDQGTGNYGEHTLFIGARDQTELNLEGNIYGLIIPGKLATPAEIASTEAYMAAKTGVTL
jgi:hypothetical protein